MTDLPSPPFSVLYADPPWRLKGGVKMPYPMMSTRDICAWGFTYKTVAFTWVKRTPLDTGFLTGRGYWTHSNAEPCLLATRGQPQRVGTGVSSLIVSPRREHSRKPDEVRECIVRIAGDVPRAELFARQRAPDWSAWGNEVICDFPLRPS